MFFLATAAIIHPKQQLIHNPGSHVTLSWNIYLNHTEQIYSFEIPKLNCDMIWSNTKMMKCNSGYLLHIHQYNDVINRTIQNMTFSKQYKITAKNLLHLQYGSYNICVFVTIPGDVNLNKVICGNIQCKYFLFV